MLHAVSPCPCQCLFSSGCRIHWAQLWRGWISLDFAVLLPPCNAPTQAPSLRRSMRCQPLQVLRHMVHIVPTWMSKKVHFHLDVRVTWSLRKRDPQPRYTMFAGMPWHATVTQWRSDVCCCSGRQGRLRFESIFEANIAWPSIDRIWHASVWVPSKSVLWLSFDEKRQFWWEVSSEYFGHFSIIALLVMLWADKAHQACGHLSEHCIRSTRREPNGTATSCKTSKWIQFFMYQTYLTLFNFILFTQKQYSSFADFLTWSTGSLDHRTTLLCLCLFQAQAVSHLSMETTPWTC